MHSNTTSNSNRLDNLLEFLKRPVLFSFDAPAPPHPTPPPPSPPIPFLLRLSILLFLQIKHGATLSKTPLERSNFCFPARPPQRPYPLHFTMAAAWFRSLLLPAATEREAPKGAILCEVFASKAYMHLMLIFYRVISGSRRLCRIKRGRKGTFFCAQTGCSTRTIRHFRTR